MCHGHDAAELVALSPSEATADFNEENRMILSYSPHWPVRGAVFVLLVRYFDGDLSAQANVMFKNN